MAKSLAYLKYFWWVVGLCWVIDGFLWAHKWGWL